MPTRDRRKFAERAIRYFLRQDYPSKEMVIVDDGTDPIGDMVGRDARVRYILVGGRATVGAKRNVACAHALGAIVVHWDDDDWQAPHRLSYQVRALLKARADVCGIRTLLFYEQTHRRAWQYTYLGQSAWWVAGSTLCYRRVLWEEHPYSDVDVAEDARFLNVSRPARTVVLPQWTFHIGLIHERNVSRKQPAGPWWRPCPIGQIRQLMGPDWVEYQSG